MILQSSEDRRCSSLHRDERYIASSRDFVSQRSLSRRHSRRRPKIREERRPSWTNLFVRFARTIDPSENPSGGRRETFDDRGIRVDEKGIVDRQATCWRVRRESSVMLARADERNWRRPVASRGTKRSQAERSVRNARLSVRREPNWRKLSPPSSPRSGANNSLASPSQARQRHAHGSRQPACKFRLQSCSKEFIDDR